MVSGKIVPCFEEAIFDGLKELIDNPNLMKKFSNNLNYQDDCYEKQMEMLYQIFDE